MIRSRHAHKARMLVLALATLSMIDASSQPVRSDYQQPVRSDLQQPARPVVQQPARSDNQQPVRSNYQQQARPLVNNYPSSGASNAAGPAKMESTIGSTCGARVQDISNDYTSDIVDSVLDFVRNTTRGCVEVVHESKEDIAEVEPHVVSVSIAAPVVSANTVKVSMTTAAGFGAVRDAWQTSSSIYQSSIPSVQVAPIPQMVPVSCSIPSTVTEYSHQTTTVMATEHITESVYATIYSDRTATVTATVIEDDCECDCSGEVYSAVISVSQSHASVLSASVASIKSRTADPVYQSISAQFDGLVSMMNVTPKCRTKATSTASAEQQQQQNLSASKKRIVKGNVSKTKTTISAGAGASSVSDLIASWTATASNLSMLTSSMNWSSLVNAILTPTASSSSSSSHSSSSTSL